MSDRERVTCPKCKSESAWYYSDHQDTWLRCLCGLLKLVSTTLGNSMTIEHVATEEDVNLPRRGSKLYDCFVALVGLRTASTGEIADAINFGKAGSDVQTNSEVASQLTVLRYKGLVMVDEERKGVTGGSKWLPTESAVRLIKGVS